MEHNNYEQMTVPTLKNLARERGLRRHSRLRKSELIQRLRAPRDQILDQDIDARMANVPFLTPTPYAPPQATPTPSPSSNAIEDLIDYLNNVKELLKSVSPKLKKLWEEIESIYEQMKSFEVRESNSAVKKFAIVYTINGIEGYDARSFLQNARQNITGVYGIIEERRCIMEKGDTPEEMVIKPAEFHSDIEINLDGTDEKDLYGTMVERILEKIATFQNEGSPWRLRSIIRLELHTVSYKPLRGETYILLPKELANKKAIINIKNKDKQCFFMVRS